MLLCKKGRIKFNTLGISSIKPDCHDGYNSGESRGGRGPAPPP